MREENLHLMVTRALMKEILSFSRNGECCYYCLQPCSGGSHHTSSHTVIVKFRYELVHPPKELGGFAQGAVALVAKA